MTHKELCRKFKLPYKWVRSHLKQYKSHEAAITAFDHPRPSDCVCDDISRHRSQNEVQTHVQTVYDIPLILLVQHWADKGYRLTRIAFWLEIHPSNLRSMLFKTGHRIQWIDNPGLDKRGRLVRYSVNGTPITLTAFATRYNYQVGTLSDKWRRLTYDQVSEEMTKIANAADPVRRFLLGR